MYIYIYIYIYISYHIISYHIISFRSFTVPPLWAFIEIDERMYVYMHVRVHIITCMYTYAYVRVCSYICTYHSGHLRRPLLGAFLLQRTPRTGQTYRCVFLCLNMINSEHSSCSELRELVKLIGVYFLASKCLMMWVSICACMFNVSCVRICVHA